MGIVVGVEWVSFCSLARLDLFPKWKKLHKTTKKRPRFVPPRLSTRSRISIFSDLSPQLFPPPFFGSPRNANLHSPAASFVCFLHLQRNHVLPHSDLDTRIFLPSHDPRHPLPRSAKKPSGRSAICHSPRDPLKAIHRENLALSYCYPLPSPSIGWVNANCIRHRTPTRRQSFLVFTPRDSSNVQLFFEM